MHVSVCGCASEALWERQLGKGSFLSSSVAVLPTDAQGPPTLIHPSSALLSLLSLPLSTWKKDGTVPSVSAMNNTGLEVEIHPSPRKERNVQFCLALQVRRGNACASISFGNKVKNKFSKNVLIANAISFGFSKT